MEREFSTRNLPFRLESFLNKKHLWGLDRRSGYPCRSCRPQSFGTVRAPHARLEARAVVCQHNAVNVRRRKSFGIVADDSQTASLSKPMQLFWTAGNANRETNFLARTLY